MKRMTLQEAPHRSATAFDDAEAVDGLARILGARGFKTAGGTQQGRDPKSVRVNHCHADCPHHEFSGALSNPWRRSVARHRFFSSSNGRVRASRLGNTSNAWLAASSPRTCRDSSLNRRFARLRRTAMPNRLPTTMPTRPTGTSVLQISKLKHAVDSRRPCCFTYSMSRLARRKKTRSPAPCDIIRLITSPRKTGPHDSCVPSSPDRSVMLWGNVPA